MTVGAASLTRPTATAPSLSWRCVLVALVWAGIYLPGLGSLPLEHEEPRRALPALHMLSSGDWLVPRVGADPYLRKPPLLNWLIALSFKATGGRTEAAARLPSVLATLALSLTIVAVAGQSWLANGTGGALAALFFLTNLAMIETGRLAELEALYVALTGIALVGWLAAWHGRLSPWALWLIPAPFLALGMLTKGPAEFVFFYGITIPILVFAKETRLLWHVAHGIALGGILSAFLVWAIPCSLAIHPDHPAEVWRVWLDQIGSRASAQPDEHFHLQNYLASVPLSLKNFLPWTVLLPLLWGKKLRLRDQGNDQGSRGRHLFQGARWGMVAVFAFMSLLPNGSPRYLYPLLPVPGLLLEQALTDSLEAGFGAWAAEAWRRTNLAFLGLGALGLIAATVIGPRDPKSLILILAGVVLAVTGGALSARKGWRPHRWRPRERLGVLRAAIASATVMALAACIYAAAVIPCVNRLRKNGPREVAWSLRRAMPPDATLWVAEYPYRPFWFYLEPDVRYFRSVRDVPANAHYVLVSPDAAAQLAADPRWSAAQRMPLAVVADQERRPFSLFELDEKGLRASPSP